MRYFNIEHTNMDSFLKGCEKLELLRPTMGDSSAIAKDIALPVTLYNCSDKPYNYMPLGFFGDEVLAKKSLWDKGEIVGDLVYASWSASAGEIVFYSEGGTLWKDWDFVFHAQGFDQDTIKTIRAAGNSGKIYLPRDSNSIFAGMYNLNYIDLNDFDTTRVENAEFMFSGCSGFKAIDFSEFDTSSFTSMRGMLSQCSGLTALDLSLFDTSNVTDMSGLFYGCTGLTSLDLGSFNTSKVLTMANMFDTCVNIAKLDLTGFDTSHVTDMSGMFCFCDSLRVLDLSSFDASNVLDMGNGMGMWDPSGSPDTMFANTSLSVLKTPKNVKLDVPLGKTMYDASGKAYTNLPKFSKSIRLATTKKKAFEFRDVRNMSLWYYDAVYWAYENDITSGMGEGTFQPMADLTRAQAVTFLYKMAGEPNVDGYPDPGFKDVKKSDWFYNAVKWAVAKKITSGYGQGTFSPNAKCTRAMIVTFLSNYAQAAGIYEEPTKSSGFKDVSSNAWYKKAVDWAVENGITSGYGAGTFRPDVICNRAMMVTFLMKVDALKAS